MTVYAKIQEHVYKANSIYHNPIYTISIRKYCKYPFSADQHFSKQKSVSQVRFNYN